MSELTRMMRRLEWLFLTDEDRNTCEEWQGSKNAKGYGLTYRNGGKRYFVHRDSYEDAYGPIPEDKPFVLHHCDNPPCTKSSHLWAGTQKDNMTDMAIKRRSFNQKKECCPQCKGEYSSWLTTGTRYCLTCRNTGINDRNRNNNAAKGLIGNKYKMHCKHGHEFSEENTRVGKNGKRCCRQCELRRAQLRQAVGVV